MKINFNQINNAYTIEYNYNPNFRNELSFSEFTLWNSTIAIDELVSRDLVVTLTPRLNPRPCKAYRPFNCKVFYNGYLGLCDEFKNTNNTINIDAVADSPNYLNEYFADYKNWSPIMDSECSNCEKFFMCGGKYFCKEFLLDGFCNIGNLNLDSFIKSYYKYQQNNKANLFHYFRIK